MSKDGNILLGDNEALIVMMFHCQVPAPLTGTARMARSVRLVSAETCAVPREPAVLTRSAVLRDTGSSASVLRTSLGTPRLSV